MDDNQPDPVAPDREEPDHTDDPRDTERSDQRPEEGPAGSNQGGGDGDD